MLARKSDEAIGHPLKEPPMFNRNISSLVNSLAEAALVFCIFILCGIVIGISVAPLGA
jgi:hypothetical protein